MTRTLISELPEKIGQQATIRGWVQAIRDQKVIVAPNSPSTGVLVAMIEVNGAPVELMQIDHLVRKDL